MAAAIVRDRSGVGAGLAQSPADFYRGKTVEIVIGYSVGGGYDLYARLIARHLGKHIPGNPKVVPKNMEGAGGMRLANWLYGAAPQDGTVIGATSRAMAFEPLLGNKAAQYDASKITLIGSANDEVSVCMAWHTSGITTLRRRAGAELVVGAGGVADDTYQFPAILNNMFGAKFKMVTGYAGGNEINIAHGAQRGARALRLPVVDRESHLPALDEREEIQPADAVLARQARGPAERPAGDGPRQDAGAEADPPLIFGRQVMGRPYAAPPGVPKDRADALRKAFMATMADKDFIAEVEKAQFELTPVSGDKLQHGAWTSIVSTPPAVAAKAAAMVK